MSTKQIKQCVFCGKAASTRDHIPSKNLLEKPFPADLLTIPSCKICNQSFSLDEEYFLNVLVEISNNPVLAAKKDIDGSVFRARQRSAKLRSRIQNSLIAGSDGRVYIKPEYERIEKVIEKNAQGLYFHKYKLLTRMDSFKCTGIYPHNIFDMRPTEIYLLASNENFMPKKWLVIQKDIFAYIVVRDWRRNNRYIMIFNIHNTIWAVIDIPYPNYRIRRNRTLVGQLNLFN